MPEELVKNATEAATTAINNISSTHSSRVATDMLIDPLAHVGDGIFLQTKTATVIAGICVWVAMFVSCQQVMYP